jgi:hypothetical protein
VVQWKEKSQLRKQPEFDSFYLFIFGGRIRSCDVRGTAQRPICRGNEPKKTGASSAWPRTRGPNPLGEGGIRDGKIGDEDIGEGGRE